VISIKTRSKCQACAWPPPRPGACLASESGRVLFINRVGQNHVYTVYIRYFWQGNHQIYGVYIRFWPTLCIVEETR
jgi:hypothetical protein